MLVNAESPKSTGKPKVPKQMPGYYEPLISAKETMEPEEHALDDYESPE
jgi:hypothetical protein